MRDSGVRMGTKPIALECYRSTGHGAHRNSVHILGVFGAVIVFLPVSGGERKVRPIGDDDAVRESNIALVPIRISVHY